LFLSLKVPVMHGVHCLSLPAVAAWLTNCPGAQTLSAWQWPAFAYWPCAHFPHTRSFVASGAAVSLSPALHVLHLPHVGALRAVLNVPSAHAEHCRSLTAVASPVTNCPGWQSLIGLHARSVSALGGDDSYSVSAHVLSGTHELADSYSVGPQLMLPHATAAASGVRHFPAQNCVPAGHPAPSVSGL